MRSRILFLLYFISVLMAQPSFTEHAISTSADGARDVFAVDVDGDGDMDVLSASYSDQIEWKGQIVWHENNGSESFTDHTIIVRSITNLAATSVHAVDMDGDGDMDVLGTFFQNPSLSEVLWF
jgi:hypothetical protein